MFRTGHVGLVGGQKGGTKEGGGHQPQGNRTQRLQNVQRAATGWSGFKPGECAQSRAPACPTCGGRGPQACNNRESLRTGAVQLQLWRSGSSDAPSSYGGGREKKKKK